jgi:hypothetical protein
MRETKEEERKEMRKRETKKEPKDGGHWGLLQPLFKGKTV